VIRENVSLLDVTPTLLDVAVSADERKGQPFSFAGQSLVAAMTGGEKLSERPMRYVAFAGRKGSAPRWLSWIWVQKASLPLRIGFAEGPRKLIWSPGEGSLSMYDIPADPLEIKPQVVKTGDTAYKRETAHLGRWFESTDIEESDAKLSERDTEVLRSLGYIQ
jgi:arylsulfatase A-like enzyme